MTTNVIKWDSGMGWKDMLTCSFTRYQGEIFCHLTSVEERVDHEPVALTVCFPVDQAEAFLCKCIDSVREAIAKKKAADV